MWNHSTCMHVIMTKAVRDATNEININFPQRISSLCCALQQLCRPNKPGMTERLNENTEQIDCACSTHGWKAGKSNICNWKMWNNPRCSASRHRQVHEIVRQQRRSLKNIFETSVPCLTFNATHPRSSCSSDRSENQSVDCLQKKIFFFRENTKERREKKNHKIHKKKIHSHKV